MRGYTITESHVLVTEVCYECGVLFALPEERKRDLVENHHTFYCPNGHGQHYLAKTDKQRLDEERRSHASTQEELRIARVEAAAAKKRATAQLKSMTKKAAATACPEAGCHRTIDPARMAQHIRTKHRAAAK